MKVHIRKKVVASIIIFLIIYGIIAAITIYSRRLFYNNDSRLMDINYKVEVLNHLAMNIRRLPLHVIHYLSNRNKEEEVKYGALITEIEKDINLLKSLRITAQPEAGWLNDTEMELSDFNSRMHEMFKKERPHVVYRHDAVILNAENTATGIIEKYIYPYQMFNETEIKTASDARYNVSRYVDRLLIGGGAFVFLAGIIAITYFSRTVVSPLERLVKMAREVIESGFHGHIELRRSDEIGELADEFNIMADKLKGYVDQLALQKMLFEGIIDAMPFHLYAVDRGFNIVVWNAKREEGIFGIKKKEAVGKSIWQTLDMTHSIALTPKTRDEMEEEFIQVFKTGNPVEKEEISDSFGEKRFFKITKLPLTMTGSEPPAYVITILQDITDSRRLEMRYMARERLAAIGQIAAGIAHEINNPMASMAVCVESLIKNILPDNFEKKGDYDKAYRYLKIIESEIYRCKNITTNLLNFSRERSLVINEININNTLTETIKMVNLQQKYKEFTVRLNLDDELQNVCADEGLLRQVFLAIVINAFESMKAGGELVISTANSRDASGPVVKMRFSDNGCGIPSEHMNKIFEPFFTTKGNSGTGLGLSVCYGIVNQHGGRVEVESEVGKGSVFSVILPVAPKNILKNQIII